VSFAALEAAVAAVLLTWASADGWATAVGHRATGGRLERFAVAARRMAPGLVTHERLRGRAKAAGLGYLAEDLLALKCGLSLVAAIAMVPLAGALGPRAGVLVLILVCASAFFAPDLMLSRRISARRRRIAVELPALLDLLAVTIGAGLPVSSALHEVALRQGGLLGVELRTAEQAIQAGDSRAQALEALRERCPHDGVAAMVSAIARADRHGARLGPALGAVASDARQQRARAIREHAAKAAPQIQLVIALGLVPATMLIVAAGLLSSL
jgi:tight adherence protein C